MVRKLILPATGGIQVEVIEVKLIQLSNRKLPSVFQHVCFEQIKQDLRKTFTGVCQVESWSSGGDAILPGVGVAQESTLSSS